MQIWHAIHLSNYIPVQGMIDAVLCEMRHLLPTIDGIQLE